MKTKKSKIGGGYLEIEINYEKEDTKKKDSKTNDSKKDIKKKETKNKVAKSTLEEPVTNLMKMIYNVDTMNKQMKDIGFNTDKQPLGKLGMSTIKKGYEALKKIEEVLNGKKKGDLYQLSGEFYTHIPHCFGFNKMSNFVINKLDTVKEKMSMLESLSEIETAVKIMDETEETEDSSIYDVYYKKLNCGISHLKPQVTESLTP
jgi:poly [ADP-ribose] polymerase